MISKSLPEPYLSLDEGVLSTRIHAARVALGRRVVILGHHYQRDDVIQHADITGDSYKLALLGSRRTEAEYLVFCGVHFMAESADILSAEGQTVSLPDRNAGCSMADMAPTDDVLEAGEALERMGAGSFLPVTYMNSSAEIKAYCGERGGAVCTSSNAPGIFRWAFGQREKILFLPDEHLGRNTAYRLGIPLTDMAVWDPKREQGGLTAAEIARARVILWKGCCSVHTKFQLQHVEQRRAEDPECRILVHPEVPWEVVQASDECGSTEHIIRTIENAPAGSRWAIGTEYHLVQRLARRHTDKKIVILSKDFCLCATMYRISPQNLLWSLESLLDGHVVNPVRVPDGTKRWARVALDRMLQVN
jgi:quinolinate synthase